MRHSSMECEKMIQRSIALAQQVVSLEAGGYLTLQEFQQYIADAKKLLGEPLRLTP